MSKTLPVAQIHAISMFLCAYCLETKPETEFYKRSKRKCKVCVCEKQAKYRKQDEVKLRDKAYCETPEYLAKQKSPERRNQAGQRKKWAEYTYKSLRIDASDY